MFQRVAEFHNAFGQLVADRPALPSLNIRELRRKLLQEELEEFRDAMLANDTVEMADALADMCYIIAGTCISYGIAPDGRFESPYEGFAKMDLFIHSKPIEFLDEAHIRYVTAEMANDLDGIKNALMTMITDIFGIALHMGIPLNTVFDEVHRSNMSKLGLDGKPIYRDDGKILKGPNFFKPNIAMILENVK